MSCNFATHATYLLALTTYKYNELQISSATQKLSCKASYKTPFFFIMGLQRWMSTPLPQSHPIYSINNLMFILFKPYFI